MSPPSSSNSSRSKRYATLRGFFSKVIPSSRRPCFDAAGAMLSRAWQGRESYRPLPVFPEFSPRRRPQETLDEALGWASRRGATEAMDALVARGADVNSSVFHGTPLLCRR